MVNVNYEMKTLKKYFITTILAMFFVCIFAGIKVHAATPPKVTGLKQTDDYTSSFTISWNKMDDYDQKYSYEVWVSTTPTGWNKPYKTTSGEEMTIENCRAGSTYYVKVRAYDSVWDDTKMEWIPIYGDFSSPLECVTRPDGDVANLKKTDSTTTSMTL